MGTCLGKGDFPRLCTRLFTTMQPCAQYLPVINIGSVKSCPAMVLSLNVVDSGPHMDSSMMGNVNNAGGKKAQNCDVQTKPTGKQDRVSSRAAWLEIQFRDHVSLHYMLRQQHQSRLRGVRAWGAASNPTGPPSAGCMGMVNLHLLPVLSDWAIVSSAA